MRAAPQIRGQSVPGMEDKKTSSSSDQNTIISSIQPHPGAHKRTSSVVEHHLGNNWCCTLPCYWFRTNTSLHKASLAVATLLVTSLLVTSPVLFLISAVPSSDVPPKDCRFLPDDSCLFPVSNSAAVTAILGPECSEPQCISAGARVAAALDTRADPCGDFQKYSCGRWKQDGGAYSLADMQRAVDLHLQELLKNVSGKFKNLELFYRSCVNVAASPVTLTPSEYAIWLIIYYF